MEVQAASHRHRGTDVSRRLLRAMLDRHDLRSADRANMETIFDTLRRGQSLTVQEEQNLWAYEVRYLGPGARDRLEPPT